MSNKDKGQLKYMAMMGSQQIGIQEQIRTHDPPQQICCSHEDGTTFLRIITHCFCGEHETSFLDMIICWPQP